MTRLRPRWAFGLCPLLLVACPVDDRTLSPVAIAGETHSGCGGSGESGQSGEAPIGGDSGAGSGGTHETGGSGASGGSSSGDAGGGNETGGSGALGGASGGAGRGGSAGSGGSAGGAGGAGGILGGGGAGATAACPDLDGNGALDCDETLVENADFDADIAAWLAEDDTQQLWNEVDARQAEGSGSIDIVSELEAQSDGVTLNGSFQCLPVTASASYLYAAELFIAEGQNPAGSGALNTVFYSLPDCGGNITGAGVQIGAAIGAWQSVSMLKEAPAGSQSVRLRLTAVKPFREPQFRVSFDNVLFRQE